MSVIPFRPRTGPKRAEPGEIPAFAGVLNDFERQGAKALSVAFPGHQAVADLCTMLEEIDGAGWGVKTITPRPDGDLVLNIVLAAYVLDGGKADESASSSEGHIEAARVSGIEVSLFPESKPTSYDMEDPA